MYYEIHTLCRFSGHFDSRTHQNSELTDQRYSSSAHWSWINEYEMSVDWLKIWRSFEIERPDTEITQTYATKGVIMSCEFGFKRVKKAPMSNQKGDWKLNCSLFESHQSKKTSPKLVIGTFRHENEKIQSQKDIFDIPMLFETLFDSKLGLQAR